MTDFIAPLSNSFLSDNSFDLQMVGGKGANLVRLIKAGFQVPGGFMVTTEGYRSFVLVNHLDEVIEKVLAGLTVESSALENASLLIRNAFSAGMLPDELKNQIINVYDNLQKPPVAVRSSATAEDLPDLSFAGQQDTFLNILGEETLLKAVVDCWSSLWTARAIGYRLRNKVEQSSIALAVVVQQMIESETSGVLFTANPLSGLRTETVIDATLGLGEALVSGMVEPDHYVVDLAKKKILSKTLGAKALIIHGDAGGGTQVKTGEAQSSIQALPDEAILALSEISQKVTGVFGAAQDIEWAWADKKLFLLQSRPITSLFPTVTGMAPAPLKVLLSFGAFQGMLDPITPLGQDSLQQFFATGSGLFAIHVTAQSQTILYTAGERLWIDFTPLVKNSVGRKILPAVFSLVEPTVKQALESIRDDPRLQPTKQGISWSAKRRLARVAIPMAGNILKNLMFPARRRIKIIQNGEDLLVKMSDQVRSVKGSKSERLQQLVAIFYQYMKMYLPRTLILFVSGVASGMASYKIAESLCKDIPEKNGENWQDLVMGLTRGIPHNPTTEMDLALWEAAKAIKENPEAAAEFAAYPTNELVERYLAGKMPAIPRRIVADFLEKYGLRGLAEIDLGRTRWVEDPTHVIESLLRYLKIEDPEKAPDVVFARGAEYACESLDRLCAEVRKVKAGWFKVRLLRFFGSRIRELMGMREAPKFFAVRVMGLLNQEFLRLGSEFVEDGSLSQKDDLIYLTFAEIQAFAAGGQREWHTIISARRDSYRKEVLRRQIPRLLLSDGRAFYEGIYAPEESSEGLSGSPVSPGLVEGKVRVVFDPGKGQFEQGEILVCPGTDPSWTPLFLTAGGLIMEVGGMMTHGAVVAREYGIPAIVGVDRATTRLVTGQHIRMDGSSGRIELLDD